MLVLAGLVWLAAALVPALTQTYLDLGWWLGHGFEVAGVFLVGIPVAADLYRTSPSRPLAGDIRGADLVSQEETFLGSHVRALTRLLAEKDEYTEGHIRRVALLAVQVGEQLGFSHRVRGLVRDHHERLDGSGYPNGTAGGGLPLETRILAVCDVYDALRSTRVYREAWSHERALRLLKDESGGAFDLRSVEALEIVLEGRPESNAARSVAVAV